MRTSSTSLSMTFAQLAGWLTVGLMFWLLLLNHDVVAAPTTAVTAPTVATAPQQATDGSSFHFFSRKSLMARTQAATHRHSLGHVDFWHARKANRSALRTHRPLLGFLYPNRRQRAAYRGVRPTRYERTHGQPDRMSKLGPVLGVIFNRNAGR